MPSDGPSSELWAAWRRGSTDAVGSRGDSVPGATARVGRHQAADGGVRIRTGAQPDDTVQVERYRRAIQQGRQPLRARIALINLLFERGRLDEAALEARRAVHSDPDRQEAYVHFARVLQEQDRPLEAVWAAQQALIVEPAAPEPHLALSTLLSDIERMHDAAQHAERFIALRPKRVEGYLNLANLLRQAGNPGGAVRAVQAAQAQGVTSDGLLWNEALARHDLGDLAGGWDLYDHGFAAGQRKPERTLAVPRWGGEELDGRTLLVWSEQGIGDEVRFLTCVPDALRLGGRVVLEVRPRLVPLVRRSFPTAVVRSWDSSAGDTAAVVDGIDLHAPLGDLPRFFRREPSAFPPADSIFEPDPERATEFQRRLATIGPEPKVGVAWRSGNLRTRRLGSYLTVDELWELVGLDGVHLISLQYGDAQIRDRELDALEQRTGAHVHRWPDVDYTDDLEAVAALTASLDAVVGPASFPTDLAGVLGVPTIRLTRATPPQALGRLWSPSVQVVSRGIDHGWASCRQEVHDILERVLWGER